MRISAFLGGTFIGLKNRVEERTYSNFSIKGMGWFQRDPVATNSNSENVSRQ